MTTREKLEKYAEKVNPHEKMHPAWDGSERIAFSDGADLFLESLAEAIDALKAFDHNEFCAGVDCGDEWCECGASTAKETLNRIKERYNLT